jgi:acyl-CoA reductase-like NAD-dependent aldehyde dehydrogenase
MGTALALDDILNVRGNLIDGLWAPAVDGTTLAVENPATSKIVAQLPAGKSADIDAAMRAARTSFTAGTWALADPGHRGRVLWKWAGLLRANAEVLALAETIDCGKPIAEARLDIIGSAETIEYYAGLATKIFGQTTNLPGQQIGMILREPIGVVGQITPWNFPLFVAAQKFAPALCCGNSVVLKPSELTSLTILAAAMLAIEAGMPAGVFNIVCGVGSEAGAALASHPDVDSLAFTGGTSTGRKILHARAETSRMTQLELGGKSPNIVFDDADLGQAVAGAMFGIFYNQGENCNAGSRLLVQDAIYDAFLSSFLAAVKKIRVRPPLDEDSQMGALISASHLSKVMGFVQTAIGEGATLAAGGHQMTEPPFNNGYFYAPTVLTDVAPHHKIFQDEVFGPVVTVTRFKTDDEAIALANATQYGLAAGAWTKSVARAMRCIREIHSGYVWINTFNGTPIEAPFGGVKSSGFGRDCGIQAIESYTSWKTAVWSPLPFEDWYGTVR